VHRARLRVEGEALTWVYCPSGDARPVALGDYLWRCPVCGWVFDSLMDKPLLAPHWNGEHGTVVVRWAS
jgi:hypothetical protein